MHRSALWLAVAGLLLVPRILMAQVVVIPTPPARPLEDKVISLIVP
jgi:hypothetical protein